MWVLMVVVACTQQQSDTQDNYLPDLPKHCQNEGQKGQSDRSIEYLLRSCTIKEDMTRTHDPISHY